MYQPYPPTGQPAGPLRPPAPAPVRTAVKLMYAGAAVSAAGLIIGLALIIVDIQAAARGRFLGHSLTAPQMRPLVITVWIVFGLAGIALWLWMARANGQGGSWARIVSTVLFGLAALQLIRARPHYGGVSPCSLSSLSGGLGGRLGFRRRRPGWVRGGRAGRGGRCGAWPG